MQGEGGSKLGKKILEQKNPFHGKVPTIGWSVVDWEKNYGGIIQRLSILRLILGSKYNRNSP